MLRPHVYWHLWHPNGSNIGQLLLAEQALALEESGLATAAVVHLSIAGGAVSVRDPYHKRDASNYPGGAGFAADYPWIAHLHIHGAEADGLYEGVTLQLLWAAAQTMDPRTPCLYFHGKGASNMTRCRNRWRRFMEYFCIARWRAAVAVLEDYDTYGVLWFPKAGWEHYAGNFWWATAGYLASLPHPIHGTYPHSLNARFKYEAWLGTNKPRHFVAYDLVRDHYTVPLPTPSDCISYLPIATPLERAHINMKRYDVINRLIKMHAYHTYLEIGTEHRQCFDAVECPYKICVDSQPRPGQTYDFTMSSDAFFAQNKDTFDLIFIDGDHSAAQVERDILNALSCLSPTGCIVLHDCNPPGANHHAYRLCGTVWKALYKLRTTRDDLVLQTVDTDYGVGILRRGPGTLLANDNPYFDRELFEQNRHTVLNLISVSAFAAQTSQPG